MYLIRRSFLAFFFKKKCIIVPKIAFPTIPFFLILAVMPSVVTLLCMASFSFRYSVGGHCNFEMP